MVDKDKFSFEDLEVWQEAVDFADQCLEVADGIDAGRKHYRLLEQLEAACTSVSLNIAEGKGRFSKKEFVQFLYIARGSLFETVTLLEIFRRKKWVTDEEYSDIRMQAILLGRRISSLIGSMKKR